MEWIADLLDMIFITLNSTIQTAVGVLSQSPEAFNSTLYAFAQNLNVIFTSVGAGLVITFFFLNLADPTHIADIRRPEMILSEFVRLSLCEVVVTNSSFLLEKITAVGTSLITTSWNTAVSVNGGVPTLTADGTVKEVLSEIDFSGISGWLSIGFDTILLFLLNFVLIIAMGLAIIYISVIAYTRFFKIYMYIALAPIPLSTFACRGTSEIGKHYLKSFCGVLLQGLILVMAFLLFTVFFSNVELSSSDGAVGVVWKYCTSILGQLLVLITIIKSSDQLVYKMLGI